jgi:hypothetical protein
MDLMIDARNLKSLTNECSELINDHQNYEQLLARDIRLNLRLAVGLMIFARFSRGWEGWSDERSASLIRIADELIREVVELDPKDYSRDPYYETGVGTEIAELLAYCKFDRLACASRYPLPQTLNIDADLTRLIRYRGSKRIPEANRHAELHRNLAWVSPISDDLTSAATEADRAIQDIWSMDIRSENQKSIIFSTCRDDMKRLDYDLNTVVARLFGFKAACLLADSLCVKDKVEGKAKWQIRDLLARAYGAFRRGRGIWWHGYANFMVTAAVFSHSQGNFDQFDQRLRYAARILERTNDLLRRDALISAMTVRRNSLPARLDRQHIACLLFEE